MGIKRKRRAFTLVEMLVVIAIIVVLVAIIIPVIVGRTKKAAQAVCVYNMATVARTYTYRRVIMNMEYGEVTPERALEEEMLRTYSSAVLTGNKITGICPTHGEYECTFDDAVLHIVCSEHGSPDDDAQMNLSIVYGVLSSNNAVNKWFRNNVNSKELIINSAASARAGSYASMLDILLKEKGLNTDEHSYRIYVKKGTNLLKPKASEYIIYWADDLMTDDDVGKSVEVTRYDVGTQAYTRGKMSVVKEKDGNGDIILQLSNFVAG